VSRKTKISPLQVVGVVGSVACIVIFGYQPSFPTPDKLLVFLIFVFMSFRQALVMLKHIAPFVALILVYESFRGLVPRLNGHVNYTLAPAFDRKLFGTLPSRRLQDWLWSGHARWYDSLLYVPYLLFFAVPLGMAILIWKTREKHYWLAVTTYVATFFSAFLTFLLFPAAPPWLASDKHYIEPITRISSHVWANLGLHDFPSLYDHISPNPVAAIPSLHAAISTLSSLFIFKLYGSRWGALSLLYPLLICFGVVYEGEHYVFDVMLGIIYAIGAFWLTPYLFRWGQRKMRLAK
jgi:membrane-associated phospholipid phosphatase